MSGASMNEIKSRIKSVTSTMQITRAMELVATSKLRRARADAEASDDFCTTWDQAMRPLMCLDATADSHWFESKSEGKVLYIVIAGDRGLAGGYNANVIRVVDALTNAEESSVFATFGKKATDALRYRNAELTDTSYTVSDSSVKDCAELAKLACDGFCSGKFSRVELIYTRFVSMLSQTPKHEVLLPLTRSEEKSDGYAYDPIMDTDASELLDSVVSDYICGKLYRAVRQSAAAESAARRTAMNSANKNAEQMIDSLTLNYNRARQAVITQEITEIVSGAGAL